jgi:hypothetical protein
MKTASRSFQGRFPVSCREQNSQNVSDCLEGEAGNRPFDVSATAWMIGQGVRYLNTAGKEGELAYHGSRRCAFAARTSSKP